LEEIDKLRKGINSLEVNHEDKVAELLGFIEAKNKHLSDSIDSVNQVMSDLNEAREDLR